PGRGTGADLVAEIHPGGGVVANVYGPEPRLDPDCCKDFYAVSYRRVDLACDGGSVDFSGSHCSSVGLCAPSAARLIAREQASVPAVLLRAAGRKSHFP